MKKILVLIGITILFLSGCGKTDDVSQNWKDQQIGFVNAMGQDMTASPYGYYFLQENYLYFAESDFSSITLLCNKPECLHNKETNPERKRTCNAYFLDGILCWYEDSLYILSFGKTEEATTDQYIYQISKDGQEQKELISLNMVSNFTIHQGKLYTYEKYYDEDENFIYGIQSRDMQNLKNAEELYTGIWEKEGEINYITCKDKQMYLRDFSEEGDKNVLINLETKQITYLFTEDLEKADLRSVMAGENSFYMVLFCEGKRVDDKFYIYNWNGEKENELELYRGGDILAYLDDKYYYCYEVPWGASDKEEYNMYVYDQEGKEISKIPIIEGGLFSPGDKNYAFVWELGGKLKFILDKKKIIDKTAGFMDISEMIQ